MNLRLSVTAEAGSEEFAVDDIVINGTLATSDPVIGFDAATSAETETNATFEVLVPVTVSNYGSDQIDVSVAVTGTAEVSDYTLNTASLSFTGNGSQNISININPDSDDFDDETIILTITETSSVTGLVISQSTHTITVTEDDTAPSIGFGAATSSENETDVTFTSANIPITVANYSGTQIDINVSVTGGTAEVGDYTFTSPTALSFTGNGTQNITVDINDDADTNDETIIFTITETSTVTGLVISQATHTLTILDDEAPAAYAGVGTFVKITDASEIVDNAFYVLLDETSESFAMSNNHNGTFLVETAAVPSSNTMVDPATSIVWEIKTNGGGKSIFNSVTSKYVSYTGSSNNIQITDDVTTDNQRWTIAYVTSEFQISNLALTTRRLQYNSGSPRYAAYTGSQRDISLYKLATTTWTGNTNTDWAIAGNWSNGVPTGSTHAIIPDVTNAPIIGASTNAAVFNLTITEADGLVINSGGTLIVNGTSSGNVTYNRNLGTSNWYLISAPVSGQVANDAYVTANNIALGTGNNRGIANYQTATNTWEYLQATGVGTFSNGIGYSVKRASAGNISFTGTINTSDVSVGVSNAGTGFNLLGNPFTSFINSATLLTDNSTNLVSTDIWVFNQSSGNYEVKNLAASFVLAPAQGFFVRSSNGTNVSISESYQVATGNAFQKTAKPEITLNMTDGSNNRFAKIYYLDNATTSFDNGYDGETFGGIANTTDVFTHLVANSEGKKYQVQSLPNSDFENMIVPVGIKAAAGKEITFSAEAMNIPDGINVYLEDRTANTVTLLSEANATYKVTLGESLDGIGRFYLHTKASGVLSTSEVALDNISIYSPAKSTLRITGLSQGKASVKIYSVLGKQVFANTYNTTGVIDMNLPTLATGLYVVQLATEKGTLNKKITLE